MRTPCLLLAFWLMAGSFVRADEQVVQRFDGHNSLTTADFTVPNGWEIRWHSNQVLSLGVIRRDNTVIAGTSGRNLGSLYLPQGGTFRIRVKGSDPIPWDVAIYAVDKNAQDDAVSDYYIPTPGPAYQPEKAGPETNVAPVAPDDGDVPAPPIAVPPAQSPAPPPPLPTQLSPGQLHSIVLIRGDRTQGTGFFLKLGNEKLVVTTQRIIADNPNWKVFTFNGNPVEVTKIEGATDRDVALLSVKDFGYPALDIGDLTAAQAGDEVLTASGTGTLFPSTDVIAVGPRRLEIDQLRAVPGCPVVLAKSGQVVGIVSAAPELTETANFADENFDERDSSVNGSITTCALRLDNIPQRETLDAARLQLQAQFLDAFHQHSRALDAYVNGSGLGDSRDTRLWQADDKIKSANDTFVQDISGGDPSERNDALHSLIFELGLAAESDLDQTSLPANFYSFPALRAKDETAYRQALKSELDSYGNNPTGFNSTVSRNNN